MVRLRVVWGGGLGGDRSVVLRGRGSTGEALAAFATFAVGFVARPFGGVIIGHLGDKFGRRPAMLLSVILMGIATVGIGLLPTADSWGVWAVALLVLFRLIQASGPEPN